MTNITAWYPMEWKANSPGFRRNHPSHTKKDNLSFIDAQALWAPSVEGALSRDSNFFVTSSYPTPNHFGPIDTEFSGIPPGTPPDVNWVVPRILRNNKPFKKRSKDGEIVVSNYESGQVIASFTNGFDILSKGSWWSNTRSMPDTGLFDTDRTNDGLWCRNGDEDVRGSISVSYQKQTRKYGLTAYDHGWNDDFIKHYWAACSVEQDGRLIMNTLADANAASLDILTALAELPEAARGIVEMCKKILTMYLDAKKKAFWWHKKVSRQRRRSNSHAQARQDTIDLNDGLAEIWLSYRLSIEPSVLTLVDYLESLRALNVDYYRWRGRSQQDLTDRLTDLTQRLLPNWELQSVPSSDYHVFIKRGFSSMGVIPPAWSANLAVTAWELVPLSFMIDRVIGIGNFISGVTTQSNWTHEGATQSWKLNGNIALLHPTTGCRVNLRTSGYKRDVINPSDYCRVYFDFDMGGKRAVDALALSWSLFLRRFVDSSK